MDVTYRVDKDTLYIAIEGRIDDYDIVFPECENAKRHNMTPNLFLEPVAVDFPLESGNYHPTEEEIYREDTVVFTNIGYVASLNKEGESKLVMRHSENLPYFAIWKAPHSGAEYICLEPWSDIPADGVTPECFDTRKMSRLEGGKAESYLFTVEFAI